MKKRLEESVYRLVVAEVGDYDRKKKRLAEGHLTTDQVAEYTRKTSAIENALLSVCRGESLEAQNALRADIALGRGFNSSAAKNIYISRSTYSRRKREAVWSIAVMLRLI